MGSAVTQSAICEALQGVDARKCVQGEIVAAIGSYDVSCIRVPAGRTGRRVGYATSVRILLA